MNFRKFAPLIAISLLCGGMWLAGCGEFGDEEPIHIDGTSVDANDDLNENNGDDDAAVAQDEAGENVDEPDAPGETPGFDEALDFDEVNANKWQRVGSLTHPLLGAAKTDDHYWALTSSGRLFRSSDGQNWEEQSMNGYAGEQIAAAGDELLMITDDAEFVTLREDQGTWYFTAPLGLNRGNSTALLTYDNAVIVSYAPKLLSGGKGTGITAVGGGLYVAGNYGQNVTDWYKLDDDLPREDPYSQNAPVFSVYADAGVYLVIGYGGIYRVDSQSVTWEPATSGGALPDRYLYSDRAHLAGTSDAHYAVVDLGDGLELRRSQDSGHTWQNVDHDLPESTIALALETYGTTLLMGTDSQGVLASNDGGVTWTPLGMDNDHRRVKALDVDNSTLRAATSQGVAELALD